MIYFLIVVPYRSYMRRRGTTVFGEPAPVRTCPACQLADLPAAAARCPHCITDLPVPA
ncbi:MAG TPA: hypothetical protein VGL63_17350 [Streptosporangiaceae bacterium]